ncbi:uncharacterized protein [Watersipora subatra]|uniref:uncharacterized protein isoform X2 n=1 Tax=Watersipora subatra TaxID=2589382 RepID=UPI00355B3560
MSETSTNSELETTTDDSWKYSILPEINKGCLDCIKEVEAKYNNATPFGCIYHDWQKTVESDRNRCGSYSISELYYERCRDRLEYDYIGFNSSESCAKDEECARDCVFKYVNADRTVDCRRGNTGDRLCVDYGIIHAFKENACSLRITSGTSDIEIYAGYMEDTCGIANPPISTTAPPTTNPGTTIGISSAVAVLVLALLFGVLCYCRRRQRRKRRQPASSERSTTNNYAMDPGCRLNMLPSFDITTASPEIQEMVKGKIISIMDIELLEEIGRGQFGVVRKAYCYTNPEHTYKVVVAMKMVRVQTLERQEEEIKNLLREANIMNTFDHVNVLNLIGIVWEPGEQPAVVCPYMGKGSLLDLIKKSEIKFSPMDYLNFVVQMAAGLEYLETKNFVHRDIALRNCLISDLYVLKISDFGLTRDIYDSKIYECSDIAEKRLPWKWLAPESIKQGSFTHKSDVWSFGVTIWELYADGSSPYPAIGNLTVLQDCLDAGYRLSKPDKLPSNLYDLMRLMWNHEPSFRPSFTELHTAIKTYILSENGANEYSYTIQKDPSKVVKVTPNDDPSLEYMQPIRRQLQRDSNVYADLSDSHKVPEPEIYS